MERMTRRDLRWLMETAGGVCVSAYVPVHPGAVQNAQNRIRIKNLFRHIEKRLPETEPDFHTIEELVEQSRTALEEAPPDLNDAGGIALFISESENGARAFELPGPVEQFVAVSDRFHLKPLLPLFNDDAAFYVLALSLNGARLLRCTFYEAVEVDTSSVPRDISAALPFDEYEKQLQYHTGTQRRPGDRSAVFHGQGVGHDDKKDRVVRYLRKVDEALKPLLADPRTPMVMICLDYLIPLYRDVNTYPGLMDEALSRNPEDMDNTSLWEAAKPVMELRAREVREADAARYLAGSGRKKGSEDVRTVLPAAHEGRVELLFVDAAACLWGRFDPRDNRFIAHETMHPGDYDLLDTAAVQTMLHDGRVHAVGAAEIPAESPLAALFRF